jgi:hypothetical protein
MERNRSLTVKVGGPRQSHQKTAIGRLEGVQQQSMIQLGKSQVVKKKGKQSRNQSELVARLITRIAPCPRYPPDYDATPTYSLRRRWQSAESVAVTNGSFTIANGHRQFLVVTDTSGGTKCFVDMWRIKRISVWTINYIDNATTASIHPAATDIDSNCFNDREAYFTCSSRSEANPGHMSVIPARDTPLGGWHKTSTVNSSGVLFYLDIDNGGASSGNWATTTLDIEFEFVLNYIGTPQGYTYASANTTTGTIGGEHLFAGGMLLVACNNLL